MGYYGYGYDYNRSGSKATWTYAGFTCNLSLINGTAFITNPSVPVSFFKNKKLTLTAGGKTLIGWGKAAGSGETLDSEINTTTGATSDPNANESDANGTPFVSGTVDSVATGSPSVGTYHLNCVTVAAGDGIQFRVTTVKDRLYKATFDYKRVSGKIGVGIYDWATTYFYKSIVDTTTTTYQSGILYATDPHISWSLSLFARNGTPDVGWTNSSEFYFDNLSFKQVLTPSTSGITIVSAKGGATRNWTSDDGIDPNAASFTLTISAQ